MTQVILYQPPYGRSARLLANQLSIPSLRPSRLRRQDVLLSWGTRHPEALNGEINVAKLHQLKTWKDAGLKTLMFSNSAVQGWLPRSGVSYGGRDFDPARSISPKYYTKPEKSSKEMRVHLFRKPDKCVGRPDSYRIIRLGWKTCEDPSLNRIVNGVEIRSRQYGWKIKYYAQQNIQMNLPNEMSLAARWAIATLGWDFGAVDLMKVGQRWVLIEANSCPGLLDENTCKAYADAAREYIDE